MKMSNWITSIAIVFAMAISNTTSAQRPGYPPPFLDNLDLSDEQHEEIKTLRENFREEIQGLHNEGRDKAMDLRKSFREDLLEILDEEQKEKLKEGKSAIMERRKGPRGHDARPHGDKHHPPHPGMRKEGQDQRDNFRESLQEKRSEFQKEIEPADQKKIDELRQKIQAAIPERKQPSKGGARARRPMNSDGGDLQNVLSEEEKQDLKDLVQKYETKISEKFAEIDAERKEMREEIDSPKGKPQREMGKNLSEERKAKIKERRMIRFLLMPTE